MVRVNPFSAMKIAFPFAIVDSMADDPLNDSFDSNATSASLITLTDDELNSDQ